MPHATRDIDLDGDSHWRPLVGERGKFWCEKCEWKFTDSLTLRIHNWMRHDGKMPTIKEVK